jgi:hypothetical protein
MIFDVVLHLAKQSNSPVTPKIKVADSCICYLNPYVTFHSVADPHRKNADADADPGKNLNADADADPDADPDADADSYTY